MESKVDLWNVVYLEYTWQRGQCWYFYKPRVSVKRPDICETELLSPAEKEEWISSYLYCQQHSSYNAVPQAFTHSLSRSLTLSLTRLPTQSLTYSLTFSPTHPHTQVDIQYIINPRNYITNSCLPEIINKSMQHNPCWKGTVVQLVKKTLRF